MGAGVEACITKSKDGMTTYPLASESSSPPPVPPRKTVVPRPVSAAKPALADAPLWPVPQEASGRSWLVVMTLIGILGLYAWLLSFYYAGAHAGVDQNGYIMTARLIAGEKNVFSPQAPAPVPEAIAAGEPGIAPSPIQVNPWFDGIRNRLSFIPETPYQFAGRMCIITEPYGPPNPTKPAEYRVYAKYPFGYSLMAAIGLMLHGFDGIYFVNPFCTVLACYFAYFLFRQAVSPFMSLLGVLWLACNPLVLIYANDSNSHASTLFCVCVGFWGLVSWVRTRQNWRAWVGGFFLGYACTIRYSEFLLVLPVVFAAILNLRLTAPRWGRVAFVWAAVAALVGEAYAAQWIFFTLYDFMMTHPLIVMASAGALGLAAFVWTVILLRPTFSSLIGSLSVLCGWAIPIGVLAGVCWVSYGAPWKTGYTYCHESTGFAWKYLTGDMGNGMIRQGNWETLITQLNHTGLFVLWPLALAGIFALVGSAWRLGVLIALWVLPATCLYMLYYWAPVGENTVGYLRFFMSIMPGLIFAGVWVLDRGLVVLRGERRASLIAITGFGLIVLIAAALYFVDEPLTLGVAVFSQIGSALWQFASETPVGFWATLGLVVLLAGIWIFDRPYAAEKTGIALGAGILTAIGCGMNLYNIVPQVERNYSMAVGLRMTVDNLRERVPKGSVIFCADKTLDQIDALNNWKLINANLFTPGAFANSKLRVDRGDKDNGDDPDPIQLDRSRLYMELLGKQDAHGNWITKRRDEFDRDKFDIIQENLKEGRRVMFLSEDSDSSSSPFGSGNIQVTPYPGYKVLPKPFKWVTPSISVSPTVQNLGRRKRRQLTAQPAVQGAPPGDTYHLWEIVKLPPPTTKAAAKPPASTTAATKPSTPAKTK
jgi:hypothetical protein